MENMSPELGNRPIDAVQGNLDDGDTERGHETPQSQNFTELANFWKLPKSIFIHHFFLFFDIYIYFYLILFLIFTVFFVKRK